MEVKYIEGNRTAPPSQGNTQRLGNRALTGAKASWHRIEANVIEAQSVKAQGTAVQCTASQSNANF